MVGIARGGRMDLGFVGESGRIAAVVIALLDPFEHDSDTREVIRS